MAVIGGIAVGGATNVRAVIAATIVARNYLAQARVLSASFVAHHPGAEFVTLVIDGTETDRTTAGTTGAVCLPSDIGFAEGEWQQMAGVYTVVEFATAVKATFLRHLLDTGAGTVCEPGGAVCFLDPDIVVYHPFPEVFAAAERAGIALTPHVLRPLPRDGLEPDERMLMHAGLCNLGFICVADSARPFLDWWHERLRLDAVIDLPNALFTDQRWTDWIPTLFGCEILRDPGLNVAYWNAHERPLTRAGDGTILAAGQPLKFFHFSGFHTDQPWCLSTHVVDRPRCRLPDLPIVAELCDGYVNALDHAGIAAQHELEYGLNAAANGVHLTPVVRSAYRTAVRTASGLGVPAPPAPFGADGGRAFTEWLTAPAFGPPDLGLCAWHLQLWRQRHDLQVAFPDPAGADAERFATWFRDDPSARGLRDEISLPTDNRVSAVAPPPFSSDERAEYGWNVVGYFSAELGVGEAGRRMSRAIEAVGLPTELVAVSTDGSREDHKTRRTLGTSLHYADTLYCVNADQLAGVMARVGDRSKTPGRRIGLWFWEVDRFPDQWDHAFDLLDEVWCASSFTTDVLTPRSPIPVRTVPLPVGEPSAPTPYRRELLGVPDGFVFLCSYDFHSVFGRKNPLGVIDAYTSAFGPLDGATLLLKSINGHDHPVELDRVRHATGGRPDIMVWDEYLDPHRVQALVELCDCFVSLHRAEGFGLGMADAMAAGRPVVATAYSGNMNFMDEASALLVPFELVPVGTGMGPYPPDARWAEPDLVVAATHLRAVFDDPDLARRVGERGRAQVLDRQSIERSRDEIAALLLVGASV